MRDKAQRQIGPIHQEDHENGQEAACKCWQCAKDPLTGSLDECFNSSRNITSRYMALATCRV